MADNKIEINLKRIQYLLKRFAMSEEELLEKVGKTWEQRGEIIADEVSLTNLKKIDKVFKQGLSFYTNSRPLEHKRDTSILFRKRTRGSKLTHADRLQVDQIERDIGSLQLYATLSRYPVAPPLPRCGRNEDPAVVASEIREALNLGRAVTDDKLFLRKLINALGEHNILVLEFVVEPGLKEKPSIEGLFIAPNAIAIRRQPGSFKREIFTLAHELGHYLLNTEALDKNIFDAPAGRADPSSDQEDWCNAFAFAFLMEPDGMKRVQELNAPALELDSLELTSLSSEKHASRAAILTHLKDAGDLTPARYSTLMKYLKQQYIQAQKSKEDPESKEKQFYGRAKTIREGLEREIYRNAYLAGTVREYEVLERFDIKDIDEFVYG